MTARPTIIIRGNSDRAKLMQWANTLPVGAVVEARESKRSIPQNKRLHAMITALASRYPWHGQILSVADWKLIFMDALNRELRVVPNLDGTGFVQLGRHTSKTSKEECGDLMEIVSAFAAKHDIDLGEKNDA